MWWFAVLGLDTITPESLFGYESDGLSRDLASGTSGLESVVLPDTSQILQPAIQVSIGFYYNLKHLYLWSGKP